MDKFLIGSITYHKIPVIELTQKGITYYIGTVDVDLLYKIFAVEPLIYTKENYKYGDIDFSNFTSDTLLNKIEKEKDLRFERERDEKKVNSIKNYLREEKYSLFPNSIIVTAKFKNDFIDDELIKDPIGVKDNNWRDNFNELPGIYYYNKHLYIPELKNTLLIIDGQHRLFGFEDFSPDQKKEYQLIVSFLVKMDSSVLAQLFYTINYNQKTVNKSLLYHLTGAFSRDLSEIKLLHEFVRILNENNKSPFYNKIKMLGKGKGYVSQAFLIDMLLPYFLMTKKKSKTIPIFRYYFVSENQQIAIINILIKYFLAIKNILNENNNLWDKGNTILTKTVGIGAFIKILQKIIISVMGKLKIDNNPDRLNEIKVTDIQNLMQPISEIDSDAYKGGGSLGLIRRLSDELDDLLNLRYINTEFVFKKMKWIKDFYY